MREAPLTRPSTGNNGHIGRPGCRHVWRFSSRSVGPAGGPAVSARALAKRYRVSARTVGIALSAAVPPARQPASGTRGSPLEPAMGWVDEMLRADLSAPRKQQHTIRRVFDRLAEEYGFTAASYTVCGTT